MEGLSTASIEEDGTVILLFTPEATQDFLDASESQREGYMFMVNAMGRAVVDFGAGWTGEEVDAFLEEVIAKRFNTYYDPQIFIPKTVIQKFV